LYLHFAFTVLKATNNVLRNAFIECRRAEARKLTVAAVMAELKNDASELALEEALRLWNRFREWWNAVVALIAVSED